MTFANDFANALHAPQDVAKAEPNVRRRRVTWRLKNLKLDEVSLVPRGANGRRFTVMKCAPADPFEALEQGSGSHLQS